MLSSLDLMPGTHLTDRQTSLNMLKEIRRLTNGILAFDLQEPS